MNKIVLILVALILSIGCSSNDESIISAIPAIPVIYVGGSGYNASTNELYPKVWKDGIAESSLVDNSLPATVLDVFVSGNDVYTCGIIGGGNQAHGFINKNGVPYSLSNSFASISSVFVSGNEVYAVGGTHAFGEVIMWKNGVETTISPINNTTFKSINAYSIFVSGSDVYICGVEEVGNLWKRKAILWVNGVKSTLFEHPNESVYAHQVIVSGTDVYVAMTGRLWKNGVITPLINNAYYIANSKIEATGVFVDGTDVYICGYTGLSSTVATLWKNGDSIILPDGVQANSVFVKNNNTYVVGYEETPPQMNTYARNGIVWLNGSVLQKNPQSNFFSVFVN